MKRWTVRGLALLFGLGLAAMPSRAAADLKVGVSGYVKLDMQYGDKITGSVPSPDPGSTPLDDDEVADNSQTIFDARQSRLRVKFSDEIAGVKLSGRIETDFFTDGGNARVSNSRRLRLRHAFARADHPSGFFFQAGQYWSLFMNTDIAQPSIVDFNGPAGQLFARQPQLRVGWEMPMAGGNLVLEADVEKHSLKIVEGRSLAQNDVDQGEGLNVPLFGGKLSWFGKLFKGEVGGAIANNRVILANGDDEDETAWGVEVSAQVDVGPFTLLGHYQHVEGINRLANQDFGDAVIVGTSDLRNIETDGFFAGASYRLTPNTSVTGVFGWNEADSIRVAGFTGDDIETQQSIHVNVMHKFWKRWQAGLEYRRFDIEAFNDKDGDVNFVHGALWFFF